MDGVWRWGSEDAVLEELKAREGMFISFEGGEGSGKSTQARLLYERLTAAGRDALLVREPGSTPVGDDIRALLKRGAADGKGIRGDTEMLLFAAARCELVASVIIPQLSKPGGIVIADRFADSTVAYQGVGRGVWRAWITRVNEIASKGIKPDLIFLLDIDADRGLERLRGGQYGLPIAEAGEEAPRHMEGGRFEDESLAFHKRVCEAYRRMGARRDHYHWRVIDAELPIGEIAARVWDETRMALPRLEALADG